MSPREELRKLLAEASALSAKAQGAKRGFTPAEQARIREIKSRVDELQKLVKAADGAQALLAELAAGDDSLEFDPLSGGYRKTARGGSRWAKAVIGRMDAAASQMGVKALLSGEVDTPPAVEVVELPAVPARLLDLVARKELDSHTFSFLRQVVRTNNAAVVADNATKQTSIYTFQEIEDRARVVAHLSEPFPLRYLSDHESMAQVSTGRWWPACSRSWRRRSSPATGSARTSPGCSARPGSPRSPSLRTC